MGTTFGEDVSKTVIYKEETRLRPLSLLHSVGEAWGSAPLSIYDNVYFFPWWLPTKLS
jgi:hypothetical protein